MRRKHVLVALGAGTAMSASGVAFATQVTSASNASGEPPLVSGTRFTNYQAPTGPEMTAEAAAEKGVGYARQAHETGEVQLEVAHGTFGEARAVNNGETPSVADNTGNSEELTEWFSSTAYLVVLRGRNFIPNVPVPRGRRAPSGSVMTLILDAHTGFTEGITVGGTQAPSTSALGPVSRFTVARESTVAAAANSVSVSLGQLQGTVEQNNKPVRGWRVVVGHPRTDLRRAALAHTTSRAKGWFSFSLRPGTYIVGALTPRGKICGLRERTVRPRAHATAVVNCVPHG